MELEPPQEWKQMQDPQFVNLGSGRFCVARFFHNRTPNDDESGGQNVTVLTGVEFANVRDGILNLGLGLVRHKSRCAVSLLSIDLRRHKLFNTTTPADLPLINRSVSESERPPCVANANNHQKKRKKKTVKMRMLHLPAPTIDLEASSRGYSWNIKCSPLTDRKLLCTDNYGRHVLFDSEARQVEDLPFLNEPKNSTFSIFIPGATDTNGCDDNGGGGSIYIMSEQRLLSGQFEAFVHGKHNTWYSQLLPPPPFIYDPKYKRPKISSYAVLIDDCGSGRSHICISVDHIGTYCLDTVKHTWIRVGDWTLPFTGKVEYVPELKLWFGICTSD
uniref:Uncharacterized protein n=1 Tax=Oryza barthii TaxID=65489 RepID=A0A0D3GUA6_9ORYZ